MATSTYPAVGGMTGITELGTNDAFIPELWSDEIIASYKANLVLGSLVTHFNHNGKKGDVIHLPTPTRASAAAKTENVAVTITANTETNVDLNINKHFHVGRFLEDNADLKGLSSWRMFVTDDMGFALASQVDSDLHGVAEGFQTGTTTNLSYDTGVIGGDGTTLYTDATDNASKLSDAGIRRAIRTLDDANVPQSNRYLVIPPVEKENLLGLARFTEQAFVGEVGMANSIRNGRIGSIYGVDVYVSTNCKTTLSNSNRACILLHKTAMALVTQLQIRIQNQYQLDYLGMLMVADTVYGVGELRNDAGVALIVPGS